MFGRKKTAQAFLEIYKGSAVLVDIPKDEGSRLRERTMESNINIMVADPKKWANYQIQRNSKEMKPMKELAVRDVECMAEHCLDIRHVPGVVLLYIIYHHIYGI